jgi:hypothetical protein
MSRGTRAALPSITGRQIMKTTHRLLFSFGAALALATVGATTHARADEPLPTLPGADQPPRRAVLFRSAPPTPAPPTPATLTPAPPRPAATTAQGARGAPTIAPAQATTAMPYSEAAPTATEPAAPQQPAAPQPGAGGGKASVRLTLESEARAVDVDTAERPAPRATSIDDDTVLHGIRFGYGYVMNYDRPVQSLGGQSLKDKVGLRTPSHFLLGYEVVYRVTGHSWLNVILLGNAMVAGLEQSKVLPSANLLIGFEFKNSFQVGVGAHLEPLAGSEGHTILAAGWTPRVGRIYMPVHAYFVPDVDGVNKMGLTTGVTF